MFVFRLGQGLAEFVGRPTKPCGAADNLVGTRTALGKAELVAALLREAVKVGVFTDHAFRKSFKRQRLSP
jgi:hypothetical protein